MPRHSIYGSPAFKKLMSGAEKLAKAVTSTLGPQGRNVIIDGQTMNPIVTKDGVTVARYFDLEDPVEKLGANIVRQAAGKTNQNVGDGTTSATLLSYEFIKASHEELLKHEDPDVHAIRKQMDSHVEEVCKHIDKEAVKVEDEETLVKVASVSANNDPAIGSLVANVVWKTGKNGVVTVVEWSGTGIETETVEGFQIDKGYASQYMATKAETDGAENKLTSTLNDVHVLVTDKSLTGIHDVLPTLQMLKQQGIDQLVIVADSIEGDALGTLVQNKLQGAFTCLAVNAPGYGDHRKEMVKDLALSLGATLISTELARDLKNVKLEDLGTARKVVATKEKTTFIAGAGDKEQVKVRIQEIEKRVENEKNDFDREKLKERIARLSNGIALIRVGGHTESEMKEKKYLVEDAVCASKAALKSGIVPGGGSALLLASQETAQSFLTEAFTVPLKTIAGNAGNKTAFQKVSSKLKKDRKAGYDAKADRVVEDMIAQGILDPADVVKDSVKNAASVAALFLTTDAVLYDKDDPKAPKR